MRNTDPEATQRLGARLRHLRLAAGLTQKQAAKQAGISVVTWQRWEWGRVAYRPWRVSAIASALDVPIASLFSDAELFEVVVSPETLERIRREGRPAAAETARKIASGLEGRLVQAATRRVDVRPGARPKPRRTRAERLAELKERTRQKKRRELG